LKTKVILESPYAGDVEKNIKYARECMKDSINKGEAPFASHLLYTQDGILNDNIEKERKQGIDCGLEWAKVADKHIFYIDFGMSKGMKYAMENALKNKEKIEIRKIY